MLDLILMSLYFILPSYIGNSAAALAAALNLPLGLPLNKKAFGKNKTWRGFYSAYIGALIVLIIQTYLYNQGIFKAHVLFEYSYLSSFFYAALFGFGSMTGDAIKSFFKRRLNKKPGCPFPPFDQIDFILGTYIFVSPFICFPLEVLICLLLLTPPLHLLTNIIAYNLKLKKVWY